MGATPTDRLEGADLWLGRCEDVLPNLDREAIAAVLADPPYGMDWNTDSTRFTGGNRDLRRGEGRDDWGKVEQDSQPFNPAPWLEFPKVVLWGANHYAARLPVGTILVWVKKAAHLFGTFLSDAELAWMKGGHGVYCHLEQFPPPSRIAEGRGKVLHPCQKPVRLMRWCLERLKLPAGSTILDPYMGSAPVGVAAMQMGYHYLGIECDPVHYATALARLTHATGTAAGSLFHGMEIESDGDS